MCRETRTEGRWQTLLPRGIADLAKIKHLRQLLGVEGLGCAKHLASEKKVRFELFDGELLDRLASHLATRHSRDPVLGTQLRLTVCTERAAVVCPAMRAKTASVGRALLA